MNNHHNNDNISYRVRASIVTYKTDTEELARCISSLKNSGITDIAIVDNSPADALSNFCLSLNISYTHKPENLGYGAAHNIELNRSINSESTDYHLVINSDVWFESNVIQKIVNHMDANPEIGQLIPSTLYPDGTPQAVVRMLPTPFDLFARRFLPDFLTQNRNKKYLLEFWDHKSEANIPYHQGSFMFLRVDALRKTGLFDERFFMYPEDIDLTRRIHRFYKTIFWPEVSIIHAHRAASYHSLKMLRIHTVNIIRYFNKWGWFHDPERRTLNKHLLKSLSPQNPKS